MKQPTPGMFGQDEFNASLYQRTDELYQIENARIDQKRLFYKALGGLAGCGGTTAHGHADLYPIRA